MATFCICVFTVVLQKCNYPEITEVAVPWTNTFKLKIFLICKVVLENRSITFIIVSLFCGWREPSVILDGNKAARWKTVWLEVIVCFHPGPRFVIYFIWSWAQRQDPNVPENILIAVIWVGFSMCWTSLKSQLPTDCQNHFPFFVQVYFTFCSHFGKSALEFHIF